MSLIMVLKKTRNYNYIDYELKNQIYLKTFIRQLFGFPLILIKGPLRTD